MIYKNFKNKKISALGMGCMRFPVVDGDFNKIDMEKTAEMVEYAIKNGVNYFDTAWGYHGGNSETVLGEILSKYPRESYFLADKFPGYDLANMDKVEEIFEEQLKKCRVEYFDFYLFHNVCEKNIDEYFNPDNGILEYLLKQKENGRIRHLGFSAHGTVTNMKEFLDAYGEYMEFCQIQLNWLDWELQNAKEKVELLNSYNIPVWVMEPVRGGKLANLGKENSEKLLRMRAGTTPAEWAFRFLQTLSEPVVTLSGMSNMEQLQENIETYKEENPLSKEECRVLFEIAKEMTKEKTLPCTYCRYCTTHCPIELNIPEIIRLYNDHKFSGGGFLAPMGISAMPDGKKPQDCVGCRACEAVCPQEIKISEMMADFTEMLNK